MGNVSNYKIIVITKSVWPFLSFLLVYSLNKGIHILPVLKDIGRVHVYTISTIEEFIFGCHPNQIISSYHNSFLDVLSAIPYLLHYAIPVIYPLYLLWKGPTEDVARFYWLLGWVMWVHYLIWLLFPHTPPWVIDHMQYYKTTFLSPTKMTHREGCAFNRLDQLFGIRFFYHMFLQNPIPFATFPSGHVAWPTVIYMVAPPGGNHFAIYVAWVAWATLYSCHHYVLDVLGAGLVVILTQKVLKYCDPVSGSKCRQMTLACSFPV